MDAKQVSNAISLKKIIERNKRLAICFFLERSVPANKIAQLKPLVMKKKESYVGDIATLDGCD
jgi:hypothetical protein